MRVHQFVCPKCNFAMKSAKGVLAGKMVSCIECEHRFKVAPLDDVDDDDNSDDGSTRKKPKKSVSMTRNIISLVVLIALCVGGYIYFYGEGGKFNKKSEDEELAPSIPARR